MKATFDEFYASCYGERWEDLKKAMLSDKEDKISPEGVVEPYYMDRTSIETAMLLDAAGAAGMMGGQQIDLAAEKQPVSFDTLLVMHAKKTGALIRAAALLGCYAAGILSEKDPRALDAAAYAEGVGLAFQITDDILDATGDVEILGKKIHADDAMGKTTFLSFMSVDKAHEYAIVLLEPFAMYAPKTKEFFQIHHNMVYLGFSFKFLPAFRKPGLLHILQDLMKVFDLLFWIVHFCYMFFQITDIVCHYFRLIRHIPYFLDLIMQIMENRILFPSHFKIIDIISRMKMPGIILIFICLLNKNF